ncbi:Short-chain dehydrogenase/reductase SDR [plant metagenome]|uniref:Short-chain dehydrogenase/reductase SDR n=2 Tax=root TaxID=1 RepID=A0A1C3K1I2_9BURK|nr:SDR family oxidoreductase [Orrella dioscoreae]SBT25372.1 Short-chain dehydrogenase/reductase SDR [Orrella dioscoreae]SOE49182.1 Short-chain dehydrogenase/reductase SDR [Orrella dioscoreae]
MSITTIAILTGASRGLGAALARGLVHPGTRLVTLSRSADPALDELARAQGAELEQVQVDLSDAASATRAARQVCDALPRDAGLRYRLVNNAGTLAPVARADQLDDGAAIATAFNLNVNAALLLSSAFLARLKGLNADRRVLNISSGAGRNPNPGWTVYCATKAALDMASRVTAQEQGTAGARIVSLAPGVIDTSMQAAIRASDPASFPALERFQQMHDSGALSSPEQTAQRILAYLERDDFGTTVIDDIRHYD